MVPVKTKPIARMSVIVHLKSTSPLIINMTKYTIATNPTSIWIIEVNKHFLFFIVSPLDN